MGVDINRAFEYENGFYLTAGVERFSKLVTHIDLFRRTAEIPGEIVECGVFKGASLSRWVKLRALLENPNSRRIIAFDTFGAFPPAEYGPDDEPRRRFVDAAGDQSIRSGDMMDVLKVHNLFENISLVQGDVRQTIPDYTRQRPELRISLLHIDVDLYEPTKVCLDVLGPRVVPGGVIVLDDYGVFPGATKAVEEWIAAGNEGKVQKLSYSHAVAFIQAEGNVRHVLTAG